MAELSSEGKEVLQKAIGEYNAVVRRLNGINKAHKAETDPLYEEKRRLYNIIYRLSEVPTNKMLEQVLAKMTDEEKQYVRVLWNTPPEIPKLEEVWCDD